MTAALNRSTVRTPLALPLTLLAVALASVTAVSVGLAILALIEDRLLAALFAGAGVLLDVFKYCAWPLALHMLAVGRRTLAALLVACALVLGMVSGWATFDRMMSAMLAGHAQHQAIQEQRITDIEAARRDDQIRLAALDAEARSVLEQAAALRERGMASPARALQSSEMRRLDDQRDQARARLEASSLELTALRSQPAKAASLPLSIATLICLGFAAALEIVPALLLSAVRSPALLATRQPAPETDAGDAETVPETDGNSPLNEGDSELLRRLLDSTASAGSGAKVAVRDFARSARISNTRAGLIFRAAENLGAIRKTPTGYVAE